jgi:hypothetical protein
MQTAFHGRFLVAASIAQRTPDKTSARLVEHAGTDARDPSRIAALKGRSLTASDATQTAPIASTSKIRFDRSSRLHR